MMTIYMRHFDKFLSCFDQISADVKCLSFVSTEQIKFRLILSKSN